MTFQKLYRNVGARIQLFIDLKNVTFFKINNVTHGNV